MDCKHTYYEMRDGQLYCNACGKSLAEIRGEPIESKELKERYTKMWPPESRRVAVKKSRAKVARRK